MANHQEVPMEREVMFVSKIADFVDHDIHSHDALEISVLLENQAIYHLAEHDYIGSPGDVFIFRPFEPHWTLKREADKPARWIMILFTPSVVRGIPEGYRMLAPFYTMDRFSPLILGDSPFAQQIQQAASRALEEEAAGTPGWQAVQFSMLIQVLTALYRCYLQEKDEDLGNRKKGQGKDTEPGIIQAIGHILQHYAQDLDMEAIIALSGMGKTAFYNRFQTVTGLTPNGFANRLRLQQALYLLKHSRMSITNIALDCGFHSLSYFNKAFRRLQGVSPREYRQQQGRILGTSE